MTADVRAFPPRPTVTAHPSQAVTGSETRHLTEIGLSVLVWLAEQAHAAHGVDYASRRPEVDLWRDCAYMAVMAPARHSNAGGSTFDGRWADLVDAVSRLSRFETGGLEPRDVLGEDYPATHTNAQVALERLHGDVTDAATCCYRGAP